MFVVLTDLRARDLTSGISPNRMTFFQRTAHSLGRSARSTLWYSKRGLMENHPLFIDEIHSYIYIYIDSYINLKSIKNRNVYFVGSCIGVQLVVPFLPSSKKSSTPAKKEEPPHQGMRQTSSINHQQHPSIGKSQRLPSGNLTGCLWNIYSTMAHRSSN